MKVGIVGLGLIGGSLARAYSEYSEAEVFGYDKDYTTQEFARIAGVIDGELTPEIIPQCDLILVAVYPKATVEYIRENAERFAKHTVIIDCAGTKKRVCDEVFPIAKEYGFTFIGGHPMAGLQYSGFKYSRANLFKGAPMVIIPPTHDDIMILQHVKDLLEPVGFGSFAVTTADEHDKVIAFTSQLAHVVSNAYIKSPTAASHKGFSAGSYKDMTRVAWLDPKMWTELFFENKANMLNELDTIIGSLTEYRDALESDDREKMHALLLDGKIKKEETDGK